MRYLFIANTLHKRHQQSLLRCAHYLEKCGHHVNIEYTLYPGHAQELACQGVKKKWDVIVGAGGDGTLHEVLNGMIGQSTLLGLYPMGTGNVFAREMRLPHHWKGIAKMLAEAYTISLDVGKAKERFFLLMLSAGFDAYAIHTLQAMEGINRNFGLRRLFGKLAYVVSGLKALGRYQFSLIEIEIDGKTYQGSFVLVSNIQRYGHYFKITPEASPLDGKLDVFIYTEMGRWNLLKLMWQVFSSLWKSYGGEALFQRKNVIQTTSLILKSTEKVFTQVDGEAFEALPLSISIIPSAVQMILPKNIIQKYCTIQTGARNDCSTRHISPP